MIYLEQKSICIRNRDRISLKPGQQSAIFIWGRLDGEINIQFLIRGDKKRTIKSSSQVVKLR